MCIPLLLVRRQIFREEIKLINIAKQDTSRSEMAAEGETVGKRMGSIATTNTSGQ